MRLHLFALSSLLFSATPVSGFTSTVPHVTSSRARFPVFAENRQLPTTSLSLWSPLTKEETTSSSSSTTNNNNNAESTKALVINEGQEELSLDNTSGFSYGDFAKTYPFANNVMIASAKTAAADLIAQVVLNQTPLMEIDVQRTALFCAFGALYLGMFQYAYQVNVFKKLFDVDKFTSQTWEEKLSDGPGLRALAAQTALDLTVLTVIYLPTFYIFKASVFSGSPDPSVWASTGIENYQTNFAKDEIDLVRVWLPADLLCFSVPLYLRLPVRHVVSFVWTAYLSFARGGH